MTWDFAWYLLGTSSVDPCTAMQNIIFEILELRFPQPNRAKVDFAHRESRSEVYMWVRESSHRCHQNVNISYSHKSMSFQLHEGKQSLVIDDVSTSIKEIWECRQTRTILARVKSENLQVVSSVEASSLPLLSYMLTFNPKMYEASESGLDQVIWVIVSYRLTAVWKPSPEEGRVNIRLPITVSVPWIRCYRAVVSYVD